MKPPVLLALLSLLCSPAIMAGELTPLRRGETLGVVLREVKYPDSLRKDLSSGLTNRILMRVTLLDGTQAIDRRPVAIAVKYDLWEETFSLTLTVDEQVAASRTYANIEEVTTFFSKAELPALFAMNSLGASRQFTLQAEVLLNPVEKERLEKIRKWVARNSTHTSMDGAGSDGRPAAAPTSNAVFNRIFEQYGAGASVAAAWQETLVSKPFRPGDLPNER